MGMCCSLNFKGTQTKAFATRSTTKLLGFFSNSYYEKKNISKTDECSPDYINADVIWYGKKKNHQVCFSREITLISTVQISKLIRKIQNISEVSNLENFFLCHSFGQIVWENGEIKTELSTRFLCAINTQL
jgi:hypothetical protein